MKSYVHHVSGALEIIHAPDRVVFQGEGRQVHHPGEAVNNATFTRRLVNEHAEQRLEDVLLVVRGTLWIKRTCNTMNKKKLSWRCCKILVSSKRFFWKKLFRGKLSFWKSITAVIVKT